MLIKMPSRRAVRITCNRKTRRQRQERGGFSTRKLIYLCILISTLSSLTVQAQFSWQYYVPHAVCTPEFYGAHDAHSNFTIIATEEGTALEIDEDGDNVFETQLTNLSAGEFAPASYCSTGSGGNLATGASVKSNKPLFVHLRFVENDYGTYDDGHMHTTLYPTSMWGSQFVVPTDVTYAYVFAETSAQATITRPEELPMTENIPERQNIKLSDVVVGTTIETDEAAYVMAVNCQSDQNYCWSYTVLPTSLVGSDYYFDAPYSDFDDWGTEPKLWITAVDNGTAVNIDEDNDGNPEVIYSLNAGEAAIYTNPAQGPHIWSASKVYVTYIENWTQDKNGKYGGAATEYLPTTAYGVSFALSEWEESHHSKPSIFVVAAADDTTISIDYGWDGVDISDSLGKGELWTTPWTGPVSGLVGSAYVWSDKPVQVVYRTDANHPHHPGVRYSYAAIPLGSGVTPGDVVINEVAWMGTEASSYDEWIELYNTTDQDIGLTGWTLVSDGDSPDFTFTSQDCSNLTIPAQGFLLLERTDDTTVSDVNADCIYTGNLSNAGETLTLKDPSSNIIDTANGDGSGWPAGINPTDDPDNWGTMERIDPLAPDSDANWATNDGVHRNGLDTDGDPINGTPKARNSATNDSPTADAGSDQTVAVGTTVQLDGSGSNDPDDDSLSYCWTLESKPTGSSAALPSCPNGVSPTFIADTPGEFQIQLVVNDGRVNSDPDRVMIKASEYIMLSDSHLIIDNSKIRVVFDLAHSSIKAIYNLTANPTLNLVKWGSTVDSRHWSGFQEYFITQNWQWGDPDSHDPISYEDPDGMEYAILEDTAEGIKIEFRDIELKDSDTSYSPPYVATWFVDVNHSSPSFNLARNIQVFNDFDVGRIDLHMAFVASAFDRWFVSDEEQGALDSDFSLDLQDVYQTNCWNAIDSSSANGQIAICFDNPVLYRKFNTSLQKARGWIRLYPYSFYNETVSVGTYDLGSFTFSVAPNESPSADAGPDQTVNVGDTVQLDGSGSSDPDSDPLSYNWSFVAKPAGSAAALSDPAIVNPTFVADVAGDYALELTVDDGRGGTDSDQVTISAVRDGDVNGDGKIDMQDAILAAKFALGLLTPSEWQRKAADVVPPCGTIDARDVVRIAEVALGIKDENTFICNGGSGQGTGIATPSGTRGSETVQLHIESKEILLSGSATIDISSSAALEGVQVGPQGSLSFDPEVIRVKAIRGVPPYQVLASEIDNEAGKAKFMIIAMDEPRGREIIEIEIEAVGHEGKSTVVKLTPDMTLDAEGNELAVEVTEGRLILGKAIPLKIDRILSIPNPTRSKDNVRIAAEGQGIKEVRVQIYDLSGREIFASGWVAEQTFEWNLMSNRGRVVANGVYLHIVTVRGFGEDELVRSSVKKLVVLR